MESVNKNEQQYLNLLKDVLENGYDTTDRTGTGTLSVFGRQLRFDLRESFPMITTKSVYWRAVFYELLWMMRGDTNVKFLQDVGVSIWDEWADEKGDLGPVYGKQWRTWETAKVTFMDDTYDSVEHATLDQLANLIKRIKTKPDCRRLVISAWNPADIDDMKLPPCHCFMQFKVYGDRLSCQLYQRSADLFLGVPFNIASYALLTHLIAAECGLVADELIHTFGDAHIYLNHIEQVKEQLTRKTFPGPQLQINMAEGGLMYMLEKAGKEDFNVHEFFTLVNYQKHKAIKAEVAV